MLYASGNCSLFWTEAIDTDMFRFSLSAVLFLYARPLDFIGLVNVDLHKHIYYNKLTDLCILTDVDNKSAGSESQDEVGEKCAHQQQESRAEEKQINRAQ